MTILPIRSSKTVMMLLIYFTSVSTFKNYIRYIYIMTYIIYLHRQTYHSKISICLLCKVWYSLRGVVLEYPNSHWYCAVTSKAFLALKCLATSQLSSYKRRPEFQDLPQLGCEFSAAPEMWFPPTLTHKGTEGWQCVCFGLALITEIIKIHSRGTSAPSTVYLLQASLKNVY